MTGQATDNYTKEVLRDAIPLLEQLLERLKVIVTRFNIEQPVPRWRPIVDRVREYGGAEIAKEWPGDSRYRFECEFDLPRYSLAMALVFFDPTNNDYRMSTRTVPLGAALSDPHGAELQVLSMIGSLTQPEEYPCPST